MWIYGVALVALALSLFADRHRTRQAMKKAIRTACNILPTMVGILLLAAAAVALAPAQLLARWVGPGSSFWGAVISSIAGALFLVPGFIAFPMVKMLMENGAGATQMAIFLSTLMMVGILCLPMEKDVFGWKLTIARNILSYLASLCTGIAIWLVIGK